MAQPADFPERMLGGVDPDWFMRKKLLKLTANLNHIPPEIWSEYVRCFNEKTIRGSCGDYRAAAGVDCELDTADLNRKLEMPILVLWGATSTGEWQWRNLHFQMSLGTDWSSWVATYSRSATAFQ